MPMKLFHSAASPYVRTVRVVAHETGQQGEIELIPTDTNDLDGPLQGVNPLGKVPALQLEDGRAVFDSRVICEYLDSRHDGPRLFPASGEPRLVALTLQAAAQGMMDAALAILTERRRPEQYQYDAFIAKQQKKIAQGLDYLEAHAESLTEGGLTIAQVAAGCFIGHAEYRNIISDWRGAHPKLAAWYEAFSARPSMQETAPPPA
ncbi:glutathione S-transferase family protein [Limibacillus halophilus]|jgi:glutathione S-transferase